MKNSYLQRTIVFQCKPQQQELSKNALLTWQWKKINVNQPLKFNIKPSDNMKYCVQMY